MSLQKDSGVHVFACVQLINGHELALKKHESRQVSIMEMRTPCAVKNLFGYCSNSYCCVATHARTCNRSNSRRTMKLPRIEQKSADVPKMPGTIGDRSLSFILRYEYYSRSVMWIFILLGCFDRIELVALTVSVSSYRLVAFACEVL